jgi:hypothetical protein
MNPSNLKALDSKAAKRAVAANRKIGINRNVNANSASAKSRAVAASRAAAKGAGAVKNVAGANKAAVSKAADHKSYPWINERREATPAAFCAGTTAEVRLWSPRPMKLASED